MANINDYLIWRGDIEISDKFPFNEVDSMILARFSYLIFQKIRLNPGMTIKQISDQLVKFTDKDFNYMGDRDLIVNLGNSNRFKNFTVSNYVNIDDTETEKQFSAIVIHISYDEMYVSYEGTDKSINGWKEDFNLAYMENIPAQAEALKYLEDVSKEYRYKRIRIGGHSKGGNIAMYAAMFTSEAIKERILQVDNFDGPGFSKSIIDEKKNDAIFDKTTTYIPQDSVIGRLLHHEGKELVVQSIEKGIYQHDIYSWQVMKNHVVVADGVTASSDRINNTVEEWLKHTTQEQRKLFVDSIFELLYENSVTTTTDFQSTILKKAPQLIKSYMEISPEDRKVIVEMVRRFIWGRSKKFLR